MADQSKIVTPEQADAIARSYLQVMPDVTNSYNADPRTQLAMKALAAGTNMGPLHGMAGGGSNFAEGLSRIADALGGAYIGQQQENKYSARQDQLTKEWRDAVSPQAPNPAGVGDIQTGAQIGAGPPATPPPVMPPTPPPAAAMPPQGAMPPAPPAMPPQQGPAPAPAALSPNFTPSPASAPGGAPMAPPTPRISVPNIAGVSGDGTIGPSGPAAAPSAPSAGPAAPQAITPPRTPLSDLYHNVLLPIEGGTNKDGSFRTSPAGAVGPGQIWGPTAAEAAQLAGLPLDPNRLRTDPAYNNALGMAYLSKQNSDFGDPLQALGAYNGGPGRMRSALRQSAKTGQPWTDFVKPETQGYIRDALILQGQPDAADQLTNRYQLKSSRFKGPIGQSAVASAFPTAGATPAAAGGPPPMPEIGPAPVDTPLPDRVQSEKLAVARRLLGNPDVSSTDAYLLAKPYYDQGTAEDQASQEDQYKAQVARGYLKDQMAQSWYNDQRKAIFEGQVNQNTNYYQAQYDAAKARQAQIDKIAQIDEQGRIKGLEDANKPGKPVTGEAYKDLSNGGANLAEIDAIGNSFKPEYANRGGGSKIGAETALSIEGKLPQSWVGSDAHDAVAYWQRYNQWSLKARHDLFGARQTGPELKAWDAAAIDPSMDADTIRRNLDTRRQITNNFLTNSVKANAGVYDKNQVYNLAGGDDWQARNKAYKPWAQPPAKKVRAGSAAGTGAAPKVDAQGRQSTTVGQKKYVVDKQGNVFYDNGAGG
jgi:hypothetical protein